MIFRYFQEKYNDIKCIRSGKHLFEDQRFSLYTACATQFSQKVSEIRNTEKQSPLRHSLRNYNQFYVIKLNELNYSTIF